MKAENFSVILLIFLSLFLVGCGMQGDLYLPDSEDPNTSAKLKESK